MGALCVCKENNLRIPYIFPLLSFTACIRTCQNEGVLDVGTCTCNCASGFSGANCESECIVKDVKWYKGLSARLLIIAQYVHTTCEAMGIYLCMHVRLMCYELHAVNLWSGDGVWYYWFVLCKIWPETWVISTFPFHSFSACSRSCQNGGTRDDGTCTCVCAESHSGDSCESELVKGLTDSRKHVHEMSKIKWKCTCVCMFIILSGPAFTLGGDCSKYLCAAMLREFHKFAKHPVFNGIV